MAHEKGINKQELKAWGLLKSKNFSLVLDRQFVQLL